MARSHEYTSRTADRQAVARMGCSTTIAHDHPPFYDGDEALFPREVPMVLGRCTCGSTLHDNGSRIACGWCGASWPYPEETNGWEDE